MTSSEESSRAIYEVGNMEFTGLGDYSVSFLPEARTKGIEHVSMQRLASTQFRYDGPNQNSICSVENSLLPCLSNRFKRKEKWSQPMATRSSKSHGCKQRSTETRHVHLYTGPMAERRSTPSVSIGTRLDWRVGQVPHCISKIDISHDAPYRQRLRYESTVYIRGVGSNKQAGPLCQRPDFRSSANALVSLQRAQGQGVPHIPLKIAKKRQNNKHHVCGGDTRHGRWNVTREMKKERQEKKDTETEREREQCRERGHSRPKWSFHQRNILNCSNMCASFRVLNLQAQWKWMHGSVHVQPTVIVTVGLRVQPTVILRVVKKRLRSQDHKKLSIPSESEFRRQPQQIMHRIRATWWKMWVRNSRMKKRRKWSRRSTLTTHSRADMTHRRHESKRFRGSGLRNESWKNRGSCADHNTRARAESHGEADRWSCSQHPNGGWQRSNGTYTRNESLNRSSTCAKRQPEQQQEDTQSSSTRKLGRRDEPSSSASTGKLVRYEDIQIGRSKMEFHNMQISDHRYPEKVFKKLGKTMNLVQEAPIIGIEALKTNVLIWGLFWSTTMKAATYLGPNFVEIFGSIHEHKTSKNFRICSISRRNWHWTIKLRFWMWQRLIGQLPHGRGLHLRIDQVITWTKAKVRVHSDSVLCLGKMSHHHSDASRRWENLEKEFRHSNSYRKLLGMDGEPIEIEWNIFPGLTSLEILQEIQEDVQDRNIEPEDFEDRIIFMSMFNNIEWIQRGNSETCISKFRTSQELREEIPARTLDIRRSWRRNEIVRNSQLSSWK